MLHFYKKTLQSIANIVLSNKTNTWLYGVNSVFSCILDLILENLIPVIVSVLRILLLFLRCLLCASPSNTMYVVLHQRALAVSSIVCVVANGIGGGWGDSLLMF